MAESSRGGSLAFGQVVIGPPGSGKTTYCHAMREFLGRLGRSVAVVNLDPANEALPCPCALDIGELVTLEDVMGSLGLGPNGGLLYCMDYLAANADWLRQRLHGLRGHYVLFDCPGQVELYTHHQALKDVFAQLAKWNFRVGMGWGSAWQLQAPVGTAWGSGGSWLLSSGIFWPSLRGGGEFCSVLCWERLAKEWPVRAFSGIGSRSTDPFFPLGTKS